MSLAIANAIVAALMCGLIWTIQVVHYPLFAAVGSTEWPAYEAEHQRRITPLVLPPMLANVGLSVALLLDGGRPLGLRIADAGLPAVLFLATGLVYGPLHGRMAERHAPALITRLVGLNWLRTAGWSAQLVVAIALI